jgi:exopolyphosphatase/guanosine-5'-triphosphate,3'-diphosphate pyrophosphatase
MAERHLHDDPPTEAQVAAVLADVEAALAPPSLPAGALLVGVAGTVTTLAAVSLGLAEYDGARVHGLELPRAEVERQLALYLRLPLAERRRLPGLHPGRADVIAAGAAVVARLLARASAPSLRVCDRGVRWGLAAELLEGARLA